MRRSCEEEEEVRRQVVWGYMRGLTLDEREKERKKERKNED